MDTRALSSITVPQFLPLQTKLHRPSLTRVPLKKKMPRFAVKAATSGGSEHRNIVDEDMLVLRKRMHENILLNTRPGVAVAIVALISLSVAASLLEIPIHLKEIITELLNNLHL
ncbi:hypothetical protein SUGI_0107280 [Cryptomeria japonica]|nr:hypothetical protein SUGI_0107280 [Cryptomeria japonica]